ncbi:MULTISPECIES: AAA family ATPase [Streptomycetaceae]|uniref:AAA family ATPase n=1 Tax=Streptomycetaceae TaxID=2062 RepID=UPI0013016D00|nr:AAA family ATPase [Streptomyces sp. CB02056]
MTETLAPMPDAVYRERTVLLGAFTAESLAATTPGADAAEPGALLRDFLTQDCERVTTRDGRRWRLTPEVRSHTIETLGRPERLLATLATAPRTEGDAARDWAERFLAARNPPLEAQDFDELYAALTVVGWFRDAPRARAALADHGLDLPSGDEVQHHLKRARLLQPLQALADESFTGREDELGTLTDYVDAKNGYSPWLLVHGPGGVGKSTLLSRFLLDRAGAESVAHVYLTFERPELAPERPLTVLAEAVRQVALLAPAMRERADTLEHSLRRTVAADLRSERDRSSSSGRRTSRRHDTDVLLHRVGTFLAAFGTDHGGRAPLLVLDTFERVQRRGQYAQRRLLQALDDLRWSCPNLRVIAAGRAPVDDPRFRSLPLEGFDPPTARRYLRRQVAELAGRTDEDLDLVTDTVGRSPLNLKLAAALLRREADALRDPALHDQLRRKLEAETVQGVLYRRILDHLEDPDLRRIASPGLIVRKVTPEVIRHVLAEPCGLGAVDEERAWGLFHRFRDEVSLVEEVPGQDAVLHRADVRAVMLPLLRRDHAGVVELIHRRAAAHYEDAGDRVEELYHRLALGEPTATLDARWEEEAGRLLEPANDELPPCSQVYLAERMGNIAPAELRAQADDLTWLRQAVRAGDQLLVDDRPEEVLALLRERPHIRSSGLRIRALAILHRWDEVDALSDDILAADPTPVTAAAVLTLRAHSAMSRGDFSSAHDLLNQALRAADVIQNTMITLGIIVTHLRLHRDGGSLDSLDARQLRVRALALVDDLNLHDVAQDPELIRLIAAEVGDEAPELIALTARQSGVGLSDGGDAALLESLTPEELQDFTRATGVNVSIPTDDADTEPSGPALTSVDFGDAINTYLGAGGKHAEALNNAVVENLRHEVDFAAPSAPARDTTHDAVVLLPGHMGSSLLDTETGRHVWGDLRPTTLLRLSLTDDSSLRLTPDERAGRTGRLRPDGLLRAPAWLSALGGLETYQPLLDALHATVLHEDAVLPFPYDWRLSAEVNARLLAEAAHRHLAAWRASPHRRRAGVPDEEPRLVFVAHSTGGLVARAALAADSRLAALTRDLVTIATPFHGTPAVAEMLGGRRRFLPRPLSGLAASLPGVYDLLPTFRCVETDDALRRLDLDDVRRLGGDPELAAAAMAARAAESRAAFLPRTRAVVGIGQPTVQGLRLAGDGLEPVLTAPRAHDDGRPYRSESGEAVRWDRGGDGLVPRDAAAPSASNAVLFVSGRHGTLCSDPHVLELVRSVLTDRRPAAVRPRPVSHALQRPGLGLSLPETTVPGQPWPLMVHGASPDDAACRITDEATGATVATPRLLLSDVTLVAAVTLPRPGLYRVTVTSGPDRVSDLLLTTGPD